MPAVVEFNFFDTFAGDGVRDDDGRFFINRFGLLNCVDKGADIVTVNLEYVPVKRLVLLGDAVERHHVFGHTVYLDIVAIHNRREVREFIGPRKHRRLPRVAGVLLAVGH